MELTINGKVYNFKFGIGFVKKINKTAQVPVDGMPGVKEDMGLAFAVTKILSGDVIALVDALELANEGFDPRITRGELEGYIDSEDTDIDKLFDKVTDFLERANATKKTTQKMKKALEIQEAE